MGEFPNNTRMVQGARLHVKGVFLGYRRGKSNQYEHTALIKVEGVNCRRDVDWYLGKRVAYIYRAKSLKNGNRRRVIWGKLTTPHGGSGIVRAKFKHNLPPRAMGARVRVMLYPSRV